jgi:hypothetical protein
MSGGGDYGLLPLMLAMGNNNNGGGGGSVDSAFLWEKFVMMAWTLLMSLCVSLQGRVLNSQLSNTYLIRDHVESYEEGGAVYGRHLDAPLTPDRPVSTKVSGRFDIQ